jgi:hypothetical protein
MNFIGHAAVALQTDSEPRFVLGTMLPDFASMAGTRLGTISDPSVRAGVHLHHRTDAVFHASAPFTALTQAALDRLTRAGVARGAARAVAHVGVEMFIDGELLQRAELGSAYLSALAAWQGLSAETFQVSLARGPAHEHPTAGAALQQLLQRLVRHGIPYDYERPEAVTARLCKMLARRPRLALTPAAETIVGSIMPDVQTSVQKGLAELLETLLHGLSHRSYSSPITS